jgi:hypothetical protein
VEWPDEVLPRPQSPIVIGILGTRDFAARVQRVVGNRTIDGHPVIVRQPKLMELKDCHVLFVSDWFWRRSRGGVGQHLKNFPVLTVGESPGFAQSSGIANFRVESQRIILEVNEEAARRSGLTLSSKLLRIATIVRNGD